MKKVIYQILYFLNPIVEVMAILGAIAIGLSEISDYINTNTFHFNFKIVLIFLCIAIVAISRPLRIHFRHFTDLDEFGNAKKYNSYDKLSSKEKAEIDKIKLAEMERLISTNTLLKMTHKGAKDPDAEMTNLIGLAEAKQQIETLKAKMQYENKKQHEGMHMCFLGSPGTGKTTVARIMAGYLYKYGFIKKNKCLEIDGSFLHGRTQSETETKITKILQYAMDGVLFIDEAYSIMDVGGTQDPTAVLIKAMEDNRDRIVIILAGYDKEMREFIKSNSGIFSRIKYYINFSDYNEKELRKIFILMAKQKGFQISKKAMAAFDKRMFNEKDSVSGFFGNARTVRNVLEKSIDTHYYNLSKGIVDKKNVLMEADIKTEPELTYKL